MLKLKLKLMPRRFEISSPLNHGILFSVLLSQSRNSTERKVLGDNGFTCARLVVESALDVSE